MIQKSNLSGYMLQILPSYSDYTFSFVSEQCQLLNISYCPPTEEDIPAGKSLVILPYLQTTFTVVNF